MSCGKTIKGYNFKKKPFDKKCYLKHIANKENKFIAELFAVAGVEVEDEEDFINPKLRNLLPPVNSLKDMQVACDRIIKAIISNEKICIYGDYDVDGATSVSLLLLWLKEIGIKAEYYIPERIKEGYGANGEAVKKLADKGINLIIFVDCGATANNELLLAKQLGVDVIVLDHHKSSETLPECVAHVNPNRFDETDIDGKLHHLCACGVVFLTLISCQKRIKDIQENINNTPNDIDIGKDGDKTIKDDVFSQQEIEKISKIDLPNIMRFTPLVAFATICDVMQLTNLNRAFIRTGLVVLEKNKYDDFATFHLYTLLNIYLLQQENKKHQEVKLSSYHFGFVIGPMVNAGGRIGKSSLGVELMTAVDRDKAYDIANELYLLNNERKNIEQQALKEVFLNKKEIEKQIANNGFILVYSKQWHEGVIGLIASRVKEKYCYPTLAGSETEDDVIKFSGRSVEGVDIGALILQAKELKLLENGGGHEQACGFSILLEKLGDFIDFMRGAIKPFADESYNSRCIEYNTAISLSGLTIDLLEQVAQFEPFGAGNARPIFLIQDIVVLNVKVIKDKHISLIISDDNTSGQAMAFNAIGNDIGDFLLSSKGKKINIFANANVDVWNGNKRVGITILDVAEY